MQQVTALCQLWSGYHLKLLWSGYHLKLLNQCDRTGKTGMLSVNFMESLSAPNSPPELHQTLVGPRSEADCSTPCASCKLVAGRHMTMLKHLERTQLVRYQHRLKLRCFSCLGFRAKAWLCTCAWMILYAVQCTSMLSQSPNQES